MAEQDQFAGFLQRVRAGDDQAAAELVREYEPLIRREVRFRMRDPRLQRFFDDFDVCQSVLGTFFIRAAAGQFELNQPEDLVKLLVTITRRKLAEQARKQNRQRRDQRRHAAGSELINDAPAAHPSPSRYLAGKELLKQFHDRLDSDERRIADLRGQGAGWSEIADQLGGTPESRRKQLARAVDRVAQELGLEESASG